MSLTREQFLGSFVRRYRTVPTIIGPVRIRNLTEDEKAEFEAGAIDKKGSLNLSHIQGQRRRLVALVVVDDDGKPLFTQRSDVERLKEVDASVTTAIFEAAREHCGFSDEENAELEKNLDAATGGDSPTDSH